MIDFYNDQVRAFSDVSGQFGTPKGGAGQAKAFVNKDPTRFSWDRSDYTRMANGQTYDLRNDMVRTKLVPALLQAVRRLDRTLNNETYRLPSLYPTLESENIGISIVGTGTTVPFGCLATDMLPEVQLLSNSNYHARWRYEDAPLTPNASGHSPQRAASRILTRRLSPASAPGSATN